MSTKSFSSNNQISLKSLLIFFILVTTAGLGYWARPTHLLAEQSAPADFENLIPKHFGEWQLDSTQEVIIPSPDVQAAVNAIYSQTITRTYINRSGTRIMLSLAYGRNQSDAIQVHKPEGCYAGQGFGVSPVMHSQVQIGGRSIPVRRIIATRLERREPVTYWVLIGNTISTLNWQEKIVQLKYGMRRIVPDGLLLRVSSIQRDENEAFRQQDKFLSDLVQSIPAQQRVRIVGTQSQL